MSTATEREFRDDPNGISRLMAAPGDEAPAGDAVAPGPTAPVMAAQDYSPTPLIDLVASSVPPIATAGNDGTHAIGEVKRAGKVASATFIPDAGITGADTNNRRIRIINKGADGQGSTVIAELQFVDGTNAAVSDEKALTLSGTAANLKVAAGDVLAYQSTHIGTGIADPGGYVQVEITPNDV
jgi:hypothetical protein